VVVLWSGRHNSAKVFPSVFLYSYRQYMKSSDFQPLIIDTTCMLTTVHFSSYHSCLTSKTYINAPSQKQKNNKRSNQKLFSTYPCSTEEIPDGRSKLLDHNPNQHHVHTNKEVNNDNLCGEQSSTQTHHQDHHSNKTKNEKNCHRDDQKK